MNGEKEQVQFSRFRDFLRKFKKQKTAIAALLVIVFLGVIAVIGERIAPFGIDEFDYSSILQGPSSAHWFGTDEFGRDLFSRILCGTRISLLVGICAVTVGAISGTILGLIAGYYGGAGESVIMRLCDVLFAFPGIVLAIAVIAVLGAGIQNVVIAVAVFSMPTFCRLVRSSVLATKESVYIQAERSLGASDARLLFRHILPAAFPNIIVQYTMSIGSSIMTAASLSFLGMGAQPPTPEWGLILSTGRDYMFNAAHMTLFPGLAIFITVLSFNLLGDGLRDALDPKLSD